MTKLSELLHLEDEDEQYELLLEFDEAVSERDSDNLRGEEIDAIVEFLNSHHKAANAPVVWSLALAGPSSEDLYSVARNYLSDASSKGRPECAAYIRLYFPHFFKMMLDSTLCDGDPNVRFEAIMFLSSGDPKAATEYLIPLYAALSPENAYTAEMFFLECASRDLLQRLEHFRSTAADPSVYGRLIESIRDHIVE